MAGMVVEYDTEVVAFYVRVTEAEIARTVEVSPLVSIDVDDTDNGVGLELLCPPAEVTADERAALEARYSMAFAALMEVERQTRPSA